MIHRSYKFRLYPSHEQAGKMAQFAGVTRLVYNLALEQRRDWWRQHKRETGKGITYPSQARELKDLRAAFDFIANAPQAAQQQAMMDLDQSYANFFAGRAGYPKPRKRGVNDSFRFPARYCTAKRISKRWGEAKLPKLGKVRFRWHRNIAGKPLSFTVSRDTLGWHCAIACEIEHTAPKSHGPAVGIDRGVKRTITLSDGSYQNMPLSLLDKLEQRARKQQRVVSRRKRGSNRRHAAVRELARTKAKIARVRKHWNHVQTSRIAKSHGVVVLEKLKVANMTRSAKGTADQPGKNVAAKAGLNRSITNQAWHQFETLLAYKLAACGGELRYVSAAYTSQTCSSCGSISAESRRSQSVFCCVDCGYSSNADVNAAVNVLQAGTRPAWTDASCGPDEAQTRRMVA